MAWTKSQLIDDLKSFEIPAGSILHLKVSLRSIGPIEGGANTLIESLLEVVGPSGTLVADAFIPCYPVPLSKVHQQIISNPLSPSYAGAMANAMIKYPGMVRSKHPIQKYLAIGARAHELMDAHTPQSGAYDVFADLIEKDAINITIGDKVNMGATAHVPVINMGYKKKLTSHGIHYRDEEGTIRLFMVNWYGGCTRGFPKFNAHYLSKGIVKKGKLGHAPTFLTHMRETAQVEAEILKHDPAFFFCDDPTCKDCRLRWEHSTGSWLGVKYRSAVVILKNIFGIPAQ
jgi:aminoglycoside 3-N-acetyltransferase